MLRVADMCHWCGCRMTIIPTPGCPQSVCNMFSVSPASGSVGPNDKPLPVQICVLPKKELTIVDQTILQCRVIEPRRNSEMSRPTLVGTITSPPAAGDSVPVIGDAIAIIPIRVSCQSTYSKHVIQLFFLFYFYIGIVLRWINTLNMWLVFTALHAMRSSHEIAKMHDLWQNERNLCPHSYTTWKRIHSSFVTRRVFDGGDPFYLKF